MARKKKGARQKASTSSNTLLPGGEASGAIQFDTPLRSNRKCCIIDIRTLSITTAILLVVATTACLTVASDTCPLDVQSLFHIKTSNCSTCSASTVLDFVATADAPAKDPAIEEQVLSTPAKPDEAAVSPTIPTGERTVVDTPSTESVVDGKAKEEELAPSQKQAPIATFDEWTKQKLQQEHLKIATPPTVVPPVVAGGNGQTGGGGGTAGGAATGNGGGSAAASGSGDSAAGTAPAGTVPAQPPPVELVLPSAAATRNYASRECGAKVIFANPEAENTKAVLNDKEKDDYMRNPCERAPSKHLVVELCETIQALSIDIANFELFSSGPRTIRLSAAERFPSTEWVELGEWTAADSREIQTFTVPPSERTYAKFIKLELMSHYGAEHYCTLSLLRVLGVSMVDEYEAEAVAVARGIQVSPQPTVVPQPVQTSPPASPTPSPSSDQQEQQRSIQTKEEDASSALPTDSPPTQIEAPPVTVTPQIPKSPVVSDTPAEDAPKAKSGGKVTSIINKIIQVVGGGGAEEAVVKETKLSSRSLSTAMKCSMCLPDIPGKNSSVPCSLESEICQVLKLAAKSRDRIENERVFLFDQNRRRRFWQLRRARQAMLLSIQQKRSALGKVPEEGREEKKEEGVHSIQPLSLPRKTTDAEAASSAKIPVPVQLDPLSKNGEEEQKKKEQQAEATTVKPSPTEEAPEQKKNDGDKVVPAGQVDTIESPTPAVTEKPPSPAETTPNPPSTTPQASPPAPQQVPKSVLEGTLPAGTSSHKESVFMKLNKRIAALELNMSLSSEYLSELSRQYIANTDEQKRQIERTRETAERAAHDAVRAMNSTVAGQLWELKKEIDALGAWLSSMRAQAGSLALTHRLTESPRRKTTEEHEEDDRELHEISESNSEESSKICPRPRPSPDTVHIHPNPTMPPRQTTENAPRTSEHAPHERGGMRHLHLSHHYDGIWTTEQVLYAVLGAQALTVLLVLSLQFCYHRFLSGPAYYDRDRAFSHDSVSSRPQQPQISVDVVQRSEFEQRIREMEARLEQRLHTPPADPVAATSAASSASSPPPAPTNANEAEGAASAKRKTRKIRKRGSLQQNQQGSDSYEEQQREYRQCPGAGPGDWDSAVDSSLPSPSQTGSEEEGDEQATADFNSEQEYPDSPPPPPPLGPPLIAEPKRLP